MCRLNRSAGRQELPSGDRCGLRTLSLHMSIFHAGIQYRASLPLLFLQGLPAGRKRSFLLGCLGEES